MPVRGVLGRTAASVWSETPLSISWSIGCTRLLAGILLDLEEGWEPTRRDSCPSTIVFSAEKVAASAPADGTILAVPAGHVTIDGGLYAILNAELTAQIDAVFVHDVHNDKLGKWGNGHTAAFIARAPMTDGHPHMVGRYQPETVVDLATPLDLAAELGIDRDALAQGLDGYYGRSILDMQQDSRGWVHGLYAIVISDGRTASVACGFTREKCRGIALRGAL